MPRSSEQPSVVEFYRFDYLQVYEQGGADALNDLLAKRHADALLHEKEMQRMERSEFWEVDWPEDWAGCVV